MKRLSPNRFRRASFGRAAMLAVALIAMPIACERTAAAEPAAPSENRASGFRELLELAGIGPAEWDQLGDGGPIAEANLPLMLQLLYRLEQSGSAQLDAWTLRHPSWQAWLADPGAHRAELAWVECKVLSVEAIPLPGHLAEAHETAQLFSCHLRLGEKSAAHVVIVPQVPQSWLAAGTLPQPVRFRGMFLKTTETERALATVLLTRHLEWFPTENALPGKLILAAHGMDVALLDEVRQRSPFVKPGESREGKAFYACLLAVERAGRVELASAARAGLRALADEWGELLRKTKQTRRELEKEIADTTNNPQQASLQQRLKKERQRESLAMAVIEQAARGKYSVAPLFIEPDRQVGRLTVVEGIARRAVKIAVDAGVSLSSPAAGEPKPVGLEFYYELEIFTADSQNLPVVCCVARVPADFPLGDSIREPVRVAGVFFKSWLYRTRQLKTENGTRQPQRLYAPIVLGAEVERLAKATHPDSRRSLWAGVTVLVLLASIWGWATWHARQDRLARASAQEDRAQKIDPKF